MYDNAIALIIRSLSVITNLIGTDRADANLVVVLKIIKDENTNRNNNCWLRNICCKNLEEEIVLLFGWNLQDLHTKSNEENSLGLQAVSLSPLAATENRK